VVDGEQHFIGQTFGYNRRTKAESLSYVQALDARNNKYLHNSIISLLRVSYKVKLDHYNGVVSWTKSSKASGTHGSSLVRMSITLPQEGEQEAQTHLISSIQSFSYQPLS
jgi:hypothetical protein